MLDVIHATCCDLVATCRVTQIRAKAFDVILNEVLSAACVGPRAKELVFSARSTATTTNTTATTTNTTANRTTTTTTTTCPKRPGSGHTAHQQQGGPGVNRARGTHARIVLIAVHSPQSHFPQSLSRVVLCSEVP
jgi:hypothetical protein